MNRQNRLIYINFATTDYRLAARMTTVIAVISFGLALVGLILTASMLSDISKSRDMDRRLADIAAQEEKIDAIIQEKEQLIKDLNSMSVLLSARRFSWTRMLSQLESVVPTGVALRSVKYNPKERTILLDGAAQSPEALRNFVAGLEKSFSFREPFLKHQSIEKGQITFNVAAVYIDEKNAQTSR